MATTGTNVIVRLAVAGTVAVATFGMAHASAADAVESGWWTQSPAPLAPDADEALVVQGGPQADTPLSYAAIEYTLAPDETPVLLTLTVAEGSASTPNAELMTCPLVEPFTAANGASTSDAPEYDCGASMTASVEESTYSFDVSGMETGTTLSLAILPSASTDRVALDLPDLSALETTTAATSTGGSTEFEDDFAPIGESSDPAGPVADDAAGDPDFPATDETAAVPDGAAEPGTAAQEADPAGDGAGQPTGRASAPGGSAAPAADPAAPVAPSGGGDDRGVAPLIFVVLVAAAAGLWFMAGRQAGVGADEEASPTR